MVHVSLSPFTWQRISERNCGDEHHTAEAIAREYDFITIEDQQIPNVVRSAAGTAEEPDKNVAAKSSLNRSILDQSRGRLYDKISYKAASAGGRFIRVCPASYVPDLLRRRCGRCDFP